MKNILHYYYHMIVDDIDSNGCFTYRQHFFCLKEYKRNIDEIKSLVALNNYMQTNNIPVNHIIYNNLNLPLTFHEGKYYILIHLLYHKLSYYEFFIAPRGKEFDLLKRNDWAFLWSEKIDYIEYQLDHFANQYPLIHDSIYYYIGMAENAILYFKMLNNQDTPLYIVHRRNKKRDLYNPVELVIDYKVRDITEYLKDSFFYHKKTINEIKNYLKSINLNHQDYLLLYVRMLYPSYYFDIYEKIINEGIQEEKLKIILDKTSSYEELLYEIYLFLKPNNALGINWINKKFR